jgi:hypothetical protein
LRRFALTLPRAAKALSPRYVREFKARRLPLAN